MRRLVRIVVAFVAPVAFVIGCGDKKATLPTNLDQPLPKVAGSDGSTGPPAKGGNKKEKGPGGSGSND